MKADLAKISMMDEFAAYAKTERKINKLTEKLNQCSSARSLQVFCPIYAGAIPTKKAGSNNLTLRLLRRAGRSH